jgi:hypothetical protein
MKKLILIVGLCIVAAVVAPVASASAAEETTGTCKIEGEAKFPEGLGKTPKSVEYTFKGAANCSTGEKGETTVSGKALLQCAVAAGGIEVIGETGAPGKGHLIGTKYPFELSFVAQAGIVDLLARPEGETAYTATGEAEFLTTNGSEAIVECAQKSLTKLNFVAETAGKI